MPSPTIRMRSSFQHLSKQLQCRRALRLTQTRNFSHTSFYAQTAADQSRNGPHKTTDFGFETVSEAGKTSKVGQVFSSVAHTYDTMNDLMSLGIHRLWKDYYVRSLDPGSTFSSSPSPSAQDPEPQTSSTADTSPSWKILDVAGGTGDIAFRLLEHAAKIHGDNKTHVTLADINTDMLREGEKRSRSLPYASAGQLDFVEANAEDLSRFESNKFDLYTVAFGIRNFTHKEVALREAFRVLKPGGVFACLEFSKVQNQLLNGLYKRWSFGAIPLIGQLVAADRGSYQYLVESIEKFPSQEQFRNMIEDAGFLTPEPAFETLTNGVASIHKGIKPVS